MIILKICSLINQKGGVGKTTTTINLGAGLTANKKKVLLIDADQSGNLTKSVGIKIKNDTPTLYEVLKGTIDINDAIEKSAYGKYDIIPADNLLSGADLEFSNIPQDEK